MPYGRNYLEVLDLILYEQNTHTTSKRVMRECSKCHNKTEDEIGQLAIGGTCSACQEAQLIGFAGGRFTQNNDIS